MKFNINILKIESNDLMQVMREVKNHGKKKQDVWDHKKGKSIE